MSCNVSQITFQGTSSFFNKFWGESVARYVFFVRVSAEFSFPAIQSFNAPNYPFCVSQAEEAKYILGALQTDILTTKRNPGIDDELVLQVLHTHPVESFSTIVILAFWSTRAFQIKK
jgi:hypothetical protein